jgi:hypothetical protein
MGFLLEHLCSPLPSRCLYYRHFHHVYSLTLTIAIVGTQYRDLTVFKKVCPRAFEVHRLMNEPVKRFIINRQR